jgi:osmoprotectant transport system substrate-binding protein
MTPLQKLVVSVAGLGLVALAGCGGGDPLATEEGGTGEKAPKDTIVVGSAAFPESILLAEIYAEALRTKDVQVEVSEPIGEREAYIPALQDGSIDLIPEYTGNLLLYFDAENTATESEEVYGELQGALPEDLTVLDKSAAEDKDSIVVTRETAEADSLTTIGDLKPVAGDMVLGAPPVFKTRSWGIPGLKRVYDVEFGDFSPADSQQQPSRLANDQIQAANIFSTDPSILENDFVVLEDDKSMFAAQNVVPLINEAKASGKVQDALNAVSAELDTATLADLLARVVTDKEEPSVVAKDWLTETGLA